MHCARLSTWEEPARLAFLFGSAARGEATPASDLDLLVIRGRDTDPDSERWRTQLMELQSAATVLTGNDARVLEVGEEEFETGQVEPMIEGVLRDGVALLGSMPELRRLVETGVSR